MALFQTTFFSQCLFRYVQVNVLIPCDDFGAGRGSAERREYKTLYLLHGYAGDRMDWIMSGDANQTSQMFDIAIVMPSGDNSFYTDNPYLSHNYGAFISRELVDYTRRIFPLSPAPEDTYIGGLSMGGYGALYNALRHSDVFGHAIVLSAPTIGVGENATDEPDKMGSTRGYFDAVLGADRAGGQSDSDLCYLADRVHRAGGDCADLYIACGYNDMLVRGNRKYHRFLTELGVPHFYEEGPGTHEWSFWREYLRRGLARSIEPRDFDGKNNPLWIERDEEEVM